MAGAVQRGAAPRGAGDIPPLSRPRRLQRVLMPDSGIPRPGTEGWRSTGAEPRGLREARNAAGSLSSPHPLAGVQGPRCPTPPGLAAVPLASHSPPAPADARALTWGAWGPAPGRGFSRRRSGRGHSRIRAFSPGPPPPPLGQAPAPGPSRGLAATSAAASWAGPRAARARPRAGERGGGGGGRGRR